MRYGAAWPSYAKAWDGMKITGNPASSEQHAIELFEREARYAIANKARYQEVERATGVPWAMVAVIHRREGDGDFGTYLGNGQSLKRVTTEVPAGRGPFANFLAGAIDALQHDGLTNVIDWRLEKQLYWCTTFNGWGYGTESPYIWGLTNQQKPGKYVRDHDYDPHVWDTQPGCAPLLATIAKLDPSVKFVRETPLGVDPPKPPEPTDPPATTEPKQKGTTMLNVWTVVTNIVNLVASLDPARVAAFIKEIHDIIDSFSKHVPAQPPEPAPTPAPHK